jgi:hypothetical protein
LVVSIAVLSNQQFPPYNQKMLTKYRGNISWLKVVSWILQNTSTGRSLLFSLVCMNFLSIDKKIQKSKSPSLVMIKVLQLATRLLDNIEKMINIKRSCGGQIFSSNHIHRSKNNNKNWFNINLVNSKTSYIIVASCKSDPFHKSECNRFQSVSIVHFKNLEM